MTGSVGDIGSLLDKVGSYTDAVMSFLECDSLQCKEYKDWSQSGGMRKKPDIGFKSVIDNSKLLSALEVADQTLGSTNINLLTSPNKFKKFSQPGKLLDREQKNRNREKFKAGKFANNREIVGTWPGSRNWAGFLASDQSIAR